MSLGGHLRAADALMPALFALCAIPVLLCLALYVPIGEVADEAAHAIRADSLLHGEIIGYRRPFPLPDGRLVMKGGVTGNASLAQAMFSFRPGAALADKRMDNATLDRLRGIDWSPESSFLEAPNTAPYPPFFYVPGAVGIGLGEASGLRPFFSLLGGRLSDALSYAALGLAAVALARGIRPLIFAVLLLPMSLTLGASLNQDGILIAVTGLSVALLSRATGPRGAAYWSGGVLLALVLAAKPVYAPLALAMLVAGLPDLAAMRSAYDWRRRAAGVGLAVLPAVAWFLLGRAHTSVPFVFWPPYPAGPLYATPGQLFATSDTTANLGVLLQHPLRLLTLPLDTLAAEGSWKLVELVGDHGKLDVVLPRSVTLIWFAVLEFSILSCALVGRRASGGGQSAWEWQRWTVALPVMALACLATLWLTYVGQYLSWTHVGAPLVEGVQGRYFIPVLLMAGLGIPRLPLPAGNLLGRLAGLPALAAALAGLVLMPAIILTSYYMR